MYFKHEVGKLGEKIACEYLESNGYKIIQRNFTTKKGEIDIIARDNEEIVFIEVKTRSNYKYGKPVEAVNEIKQRHMLNTIKYYLYINKLENNFIRIDTIEIFLHKDSCKINHIKQIF